ncbi:DUF4358 domain-containing protein [uncultured Tyzzerella sp.]|uniref:DUF4358 domain-containing protein n=1 Tax=uncultured Tyzzerella sp. TaxID=2321398 RepID=UPI0029422D66|nr:DUF4358 domain-containing protein [uncultured Tyzzerella sp.]
MKKILLLIFVLLFTGCSNDTLPNISSEYILKKINEKITFDNSMQEDLKEQSIAERYGISPKDIESGVVYYTKDEDKSDKIIIAKASSKDTIENIERALSAEIIGVSDSWKANDKEMEKIEKHILKTKDVYVIMAISNDSKKIEKIFDSCF